MGAAAGCLAATAVAWIVLGKPDFSMILNGTLAGLVAVTAPCAFITVPAAVTIGTIAGVLVVFAVLMFDKLKLDDPVGALSVHLVNGVWGTLAVGLFATDGGLFYGGGAALMITQIKGVLGVGAFTLVASALAWYLLKFTIGIRVSAEEEMEGLDIGEHGMQAYVGLSSPGSPLSASSVSAT
jgi:Amt family ammonium transporter